MAGGHNSTRVGERRYNFVWYRPADEAGELRRLMTDADGLHHAAGIPPHKVSWRALAQMRAQARATLAPQWAEVVEKTAQPFLQPIHDLMSQRLAFGRIALMGDAAFVARPHVGMGVTKAGDDAVALARAVAVHGATAAALQAYEAERLAPGHSVVDRARGLGAYLEAHARPGWPGANRSPPRDALSVLRQTAIDLAVPA